MYSIGSASGPTRQNKPLHQSKPGIFSIFVNSIEISEATDIMTVGSFVASIVSGMKAPSLRKARPSEHGACLRVRSGV